MKLSVDQGDFEAICGFSAGKFTHTHPGFTFLCGVIFTLVFYGVLLPFRYRGSVMIEMFFPGGEMNRSVIPVFTVFLAMWSLAILLDKLHKLSIQRKALTVNVLPDDPFFVLTPLTAQEILENIRHQVETPEAFLLFDRMMRALANLKNLGDLPAVADCLARQGANDENTLTNSYTILKGFIWAIPVLGFIGTVVGLADAVGGFGSAVSSGASVENLKNALGGVTGGLATAFETTLIALVLALIIQLLMSFVISKEEHFLDECADYCHKNLISRMKNPRYTEFEG